MTTLAQRLTRIGATAAQLEASVRHVGDGRLRADRTMIEQASDETVARLAEVHGSVWPAIAVRLHAACREADVPVIVGDDGTTCLKLYANLSDAAEATRATVASAIGLGDAPHVIGINAHRDGRIELKAYRQVADAAALAARHGEAARRLVAAAQGICAGGVLSEDVALDDSTSRHPRALFVALRPATPAQLDAAFSWLPGFSWAALVAALPFSPRAPRSIGLALADPETWTAYLKPLADAPLLHALEPIAVFACDAGEVGIYVEPSDATPRAYLRVDGRAVSYRVRAGAPTGPDVDALLRWIGARLHAQGPDAALDDPPAPWRRT